MPRRRCALRAPHGAIAPTESSTCHAGRAWRESSVSLGLLSATYVLIHVTGGVTEAHFHFFIALLAVALYQRWTPYLLALATVVVHHFTMSALAPELIFGHRAAVANPFVWTIIHAVFVIIAAA